MPQGTEERNRGEAEEDSWAIAAPPEIPENFLVVWDNGTVVATITMREVLSWQGRIAALEERVQKLEQRLARSAFRTAELLKERIGPTPQEMAKLMLHDAELYREEDGTKYYRDNDKFPPQFYLKRWASCVECWMVDQTEESLEVADDQGVMHTVTRPKYPTGRRFVVSDNQLINDGPADQWPPPWPIS